MSDDNKKIQFPDTKDADSLKKIQPAAAPAASAVFFSPALLITHCGFDRDPVKEYNALAPAEHYSQEPFFIDLRDASLSFFSGLGRSAATPYMPAISWDSRVYGIARERAEECLAFIRGIAFRSAAGRLFQSFSHVVAIPNPIAPKTAQWSEVVVFGAFSFCCPTDIDSRAFVVYMRNTGLLPRPKIEKFDTDEQLRVFLSSRSVSMFERSFGALED